MSNFNSSIAIKTTATWGAILRYLYLPMQVILSLSKTMPGGHKQGPSTVIRRHCLVQLGSFDDEQS